MSASFMGEGELLIITILALSQGSTNILLILYESCSYVAFRFADGEFTYPY